VLTVCSKVPSYNTWPKLQNEKCTKPRSLATDTNTREVRKGIKGAALYNSVIAPHVKVK